MIILDSLLVNPTHPLFVKQSLKFQMFHGPILVVWNLSNENSKSWSNTQSSIQKNSSNSAWHHQRVYFSMVSTHQIMRRLIVFVFKVHPVVVKHFWQRLLPTNAKLTSFQSRYLFLLFTYFFLLFIFLFIYYLVYLLFCFSGSRIAYYVVWWIRSQCSWSLW